MQQDFPLDRADTIPIRRFVKLRRIPRAGEGVYRTSYFDPVAILIDNGWRKIGRSKSRPGVWYLRAPDAHSTSPFLLTVHVPTEAAIARLTERLIAERPSEGWCGHLGSWRGTFEPEGPRGLCGTVMRAMTHEDRIKIKSPLFTLGYPGVWYMWVRWYEGLGRLPSWDVSQYVSHLRYDHDDG